MVPTEHPHRRRFLQLIGGAGLVGIAGCLGDDDDDADDIDDTDDTTDDTDDTDDTTDDTDDSADDDLDVTFALSSFEPRDTTVQIGEVYDVSVEVTNTGSDEGAKDVTYRIDGDDIVVEEYTLGGFENESVTFEEIETEEFEAGEYTHGFYTEDDEAEGTLTLDPPTDLDDTLIEFADDPLYLGIGENDVFGQLSSSYNFEIEDGEVVFSVPDGWEITEESGLTFDVLGAFDSQDFSLTIDVPDGEAGDHTISASVTYTDGISIADLEHEQEVTVLDESAAQYYWTAEAYDVDDTPDDSWEPMWAINSFDIAEDGDGKYLSLDGGGNDRSNLRFSVPDGPSFEHEVWARAKAVDEEGGDHYVYARGHDEDDPQGALTASRFDDYVQNDVFRIAEYASGGYNTIDTTDHVGIDVVYELRAQVTGGTMRAKWWPADEDEPEDWDLEADAPAEQPGWAGIGSWSGEDYIVYEFGLGVGGAAAPGSD